MKTTGEIAFDLYDKATMVLVGILLSPFILFVGLCYAPFWIIAKIYTTWFQKESK